MLASGAVKQVRRHALLGVARPVRFQTLRVQRTGKPGSTCSHKAMTRSGNMRTDPERVEFTPNEMESEFHGFSGFRDNSFVIHK